MMLKRKAFLVWIPAILLMCALAGCGPGGPATATVTGTVTLDGTPVDGAVVVFEPTEGGNPVTGTTDASGKYTVNALLGPNQIGVTKTKTTGATSDPESGEGEQLAGDMDSVQTEYLIPVKYAAPKESGLTADVKRGMDPVNLELTSQ